MEHPERKPNRLPQPNYNQPGAYFLTLCARERKPYFRSSYGTEAPLSPLGVILENAIRKIPDHYPAVTVDHYVIMADHIHLLLQIHHPGGKGISTVVQQLKSAVSRQAGSPVWQKGFYDHVIRNEADYRARWLYIEGNPARAEEKRNNGGLKKQECT